MHFSGVVITDDMQMLAIRDNFGLKQAITLAINAGADMLMFTHQLAPNEPDQDPKELIDLIEKEVHIGHISEATIDTAYQRPVQLHETVCNIDLSYIRHEDKERFENIEEMRQAVAGFVATLKNFIVGLLGILITTEDARKSVSMAHSIGKFGLFPEVETELNSTVAPENANPLTSFQS